MLRETSPSDSCPDDGASFPEFFSDRARCLCFTGHRLIRDRDVPALSAALDSALEQAWEDGFRFFFSGAALGFDLLAAQAVLRLRHVHPDARLLLALPCPSQADRWSWQDRKTHQDILSEADQVVCVSPAYFEGCMQKRNRYMVDHSARCLCYLRVCRGGTWYTVSYAYDQGLEIRNLALTFSGSGFT